ncbi:MULTISPECIES: hypothetical protein [Rhodopseudomonas]|uniref:hypothetical protein n=1 Tax=Rhodopseudomonas TaxID=1073 RepID=UPI0013648ACE|nr:MULTISPECIES: hypothetical protein [Rhodopseudomonas]MDF3810987.1 hypothetical protein [Rhodopseudomonas sp. BAL398]WOK15888.1 hypothetical protein RBJ75_17115 [Rhodopseudomonas sp. BAL398]
MAIISPSSTDPEHAATAAMLTRFRVMTSDSEEEESNGGFFAFRRLDADGFFTAIATPK